MGVRVKNTKIGKAKDNYSPNDSLFTPPEIFEALNVRFDVDVCAPTGGLAWIPANRSIDEAEDGLMSQWTGRVWMNPPYSNPTPWIDKWISHNNGFAFVPFAKAKWFDRLWESEAKSCLIYYRGLFVKTDYKRTDIYSPVAIWAIGETNITALEMSNLGRVR
jgi:hypothetical protein